MNLIARKLEPTPSPMPRNLHPAVQEHAANYSDMLHELDRVNEDNRSLRNDLEVEQRTCAELRRLLDNERRQKEQYMRYSVEVKTHLAAIAQSAIAANERALDCAEQPQAPAPLDTLENAIGKVIAECVAGKEVSAQ